MLDLVRAPQISQAMALAERVYQVIPGASDNDRTDVEIVFATKNLLPNLPLENAIQENLVATGPVPFDIVGFRHQ